MTMLPYEIVEQKLMKKRLGVWLMELVLFFLKVVALPSLSKASLLQVWGV